MSKFSAVSLFKTLFRRHTYSSVFVGSAITLVVSVQAGFACSSHGSIIAGFDDQAYIFLGKVKRNTLAVEIQGTESKVFGLSVEVTDRVFPTTGPSEYVVVPTRTMADCSRGGLNVKELALSYPIGSEVRVIARLAHGIRMSVPASQTLLEAGYENHTSVSLNHSEAKKGRTSLESEFDYELADNTFLDSSSERYYFVAFEIQKDLVRLEHAESDVARLSILKRLRDAPVYAQLNFDLLEAVYTMSKPMIPKNF